MAKYDGAIVQALHDHPDLKSTKALAGLLSAPYATITVGISGLLRKGIITYDDIPWRKGFVPPASKPRIDQASTSNIAEHLKRIINENGTDRVAALRALVEYNTLIATDTAMPKPGDTEAATAALIRILVAAGREVSAIAFRAAFPNHDILFTEAPNAEPASPPQAERPEPAAGGGNLA